MASPVVRTVFSPATLALTYLFALAGCAFYEPPQSLYTARPQEVLDNPSEIGSGTTHGSTPMGGPGSVPGAPQEGGASPAPGFGQPSPTDPGTAGGATDQTQPGTGSPQRMPQFEPVEPAVLQDRLASIAEALAKYTSQNGGKLPEFTSGGSFRKAIVALMKDESAWPVGTMIVPRAISGMKLDQIPNRSETPLLVAGPLGTDGRRYAVFADLTVKVVPEQEPVSPPQQPREVPPTGVDF